MSQTGSTSPPPAVEASTVDRALSFPEIYEVFAPRIRRYLGRLAGSRDAEDLAQEVLARASQALPGFRGDSKVSTWLYRIATNVAMDRLRSPSVRRGREALIQIQHAWTTPPSPFDQELVRREMSDCVRGYIESLPPGYRSVLLLSEDEGLSNREIARALGVTLETVKIRLHRARARLKSQMSRGCSFYRDHRNELACEPRPRGVSPDE
jgi:RNA polymerase sigma-70 factor (ECF subfamily)